jgi:hypothetical protein
MDTLFVKVAGLDVHLKGIQCAVRCRQESGKLFTQVRSFGLPAAEAVSEPVPAAQGHKRRGRAAP